LGKAGSEPGLEQKIGRNAHEPHVSASANIAQWPSPASFYLVKELTKSERRGYREGMEPVSVHEAKTHLSRLLQRVEAGEEVVIARAGHPIARLVPIAPKRPRVPGRLKGAVTIADDFDAPLPEELWTSEL
jgi:prevent-host-death family protein